MAGIGTQVLMAAGPTLSRWAILWLQPEELPVE